MNKETWLALIRHGLTFLGGLLVTKGMLDNAQSSELIGAIITIVSVTWFMLTKKSAPAAPTNINTNN